jgi:divinyl chlorophyllide a 8-vinyl-reductase
MEPKFRQVPVAMMDAIIGLAGFWDGSARRGPTGRNSRGRALLRDRVDAGLGRGAGRYDADATPEFGTDTLAQHYARLIAGEAEVDLREHAVF